MKFEIMLSILFELLSKKVVSASYLAQKYSVSTRSIYRYISSLEQAGVPVYTTRGNGGGFSLVDTYRLSSTFLTVKEFDQVISALTAIVDGVPDKTLSNAILKLKASVKNEYSNLNIKSGELIIDAGNWGDTEGYKSKLLVIKESIEKCAPLQITYHDRNGSVSERIIEPHVIVFKQGLWYTYAYCNLRKEFRFFKTGRIEKATMLNGRFIKKDLNKLDLPLDFWHNSTTVEEVEMEIDKKVLSDVEEWLGIENVKEENGKYISKVKLPYDDALAIKIMSYGSGIKVVSPQKLKDKIMNNLEELTKIYK